MRIFLLATAILAFISTIESAKAEQEKPSVWDNLVAWHGDAETEEQRRDRLEMIDTAIDRAVERATCDEDEKDCKALWSGTKSDLRWLLLGQAYFETHLARHVHADKCKASECDQGRAKSLWQVQATSVVPQKEWETLGGITQESTDRAAWAATKVLSLTYNRCRTLGGAISMYATGKTCSWKGSTKRVLWILESRERYSPRMSQ